MLAECCITQFPVFSKWNSPKTNYIGFIFVILNNTWYKYNGEILEKNYVFPNVTWTNNFDDFPSETDECWNNPVIKQIIKEEDKHPHAVRLYFYKDAFEELKKNIIPRDNLDDFLLEEGTSEDVRVLLTFLNMMCSNLSSLTSYRRFSEEYKDRKKIVEDQTDLFQKSILEINKI